MGARRTHNPGGRRFDSARGYGSARLVTEPGCAQATRRDPRSRKSAAVGWRWFPALAHRGPGYIPRMGILLLVLIFALLLGGFGFVVHFLWWVALFALALWVIGFFVGRSRRE